MSNELISLQDTKIAINNLDFFYGDFHALKNINLRIAKNKVTAFVGPSGCGKSTLLRTLNRMYEQYPNQSAQGEILFEGENLLTTETDIALIRAKIGMVFQKPTPFPMSIYDNVAFGIRLFEKLPKSELNDRVEWALTKAALWNEVKDKSKRRQFIRRSATAFMYCTRYCGKTGSFIVRRTLFGARPDFNHENRRIDQRVETRLYGGDCDP